MQPSEKSRFDALYPQHLRALTLQGKADATIDSYSRAVRRLAEFVDRCPDPLTAEDLKAYFAHPTQTRPWSLVKIERDLVAYDPERATVTFRYRDASTGQTAYRSPSIADLLWRILLHVLPQGFRRVREYGFLHPKAKIRLRVVQLLLHDAIAERATPQKPIVCCPHCQTPMRLVGVSFRKRPDG